jgi:DHA1 family multidrug resistance protein-like MFS transporter
LGYQAIFGCLLVLCFLSLFLSLVSFSDILPARKTPKAKSEFRTVLQNNKLLGLASFIFTRSFGIILTAIFLPLLLHDRKLNGLEIGIIMAIGTALTALLLRPFGRMSDKVDRAMIIKVGGISVALLMCYLPLAGAYWEFIFLCAGIGVCNALTIPASSALLVEEGRRHGMGLTIGVFNSVMNLGFFLAPPLGGILMDNYSLSSIFLIAGVINIVGIMFFAVLCRKDVCVGIEAMNISMRR